MIRRWATVCVLWESRCILDVGSWTRTFCRMHHTVVSSLVYQISKFCWGGHTVDLTIMANYSKYIWPLLSSLVFTATAVNMVDQRKTLESERLKTSTQISALESLVERLRAGESVTDEEIYKIKRRVGLVNSLQQNATEPSWKDTLFNAVKPSAQSVQAEEEQVQKGEDLVEEDKWFCSVSSSDTRPVRP